MDPHEFPNRTEYVLGFAFSHTMRSVVLMEKNRPAWQAGKLNGVGGKMRTVMSLSGFGDIMEKPHQGMIREFHEETGVLTTDDSWVLFHTMRFQNGAVIYCFATRLPVGTPVTTMEDEPVDVYPVDEFGLKCELPTIPNLRWLVPMAYHQLQEPERERMLA